MASTEFHESRLNRTPRRALGQPISSSGPPTSRVAGFCPAIDFAKPAELMTSLLNIGCPEQTIREIILLGLARKYRQRLRDSDAEFARSWDYTRSLPRDHWDKRVKFANQLRGELSAELESLLGSDLESLRRTVLTFTPCGADRLDFLPPSQRRKVRDVEVRYHGLKNDLNRRGMMGLLDAEDRAELRRLEVAQRAELAKILSASELQDYLCRWSAAAAYVRNHLPQAKSEQEFRQMVQVALDMNMFEEPVSFYQRYGLPGPEDPGVKELQARQAAFQDTIKQVLGEKRFAELQAEEQALLQKQQREREQHELERERVRIIRIAAPLGISAEDASRLVDRLNELRPALQSRFDELEKSLTGTREERNKQMQAAFRAEMERITFECLGEKGRELAKKLLPT